jgi:hypothetical protein
MSIMQFSTPSVSFYLSLDSAKLYYPATNKKKRREYVLALDNIIIQHACLFAPISVAPINSFHAALLNSLIDGVSFLSEHQRIPSFP